MQKIMVEGHTGQDVEIRDLGGGNKVANVSLAETEKYKDKDGKPVTVTTWFNLEIWNRQAEIFDQYVKKGNHIMVWGKMKNEKYEDKEGNKRDSWKLKVSEMKMLGGNPKQEQPKQESNEPETDKLPF